MEGVFVSVYEACTWDLLCPSDVAHCSGVAHKIELLLIMAVVISYAVPKTMSKDIEHYLQDTMTERDSVRLQK